MPVSNKKIPRDKTVTFDIRGKSAKCEDGVPNSNNFLTIAPALPILPGAPIPPKLLNRSYNSVGSSELPFNVEHAEGENCNAVTLQWTGEARTIMATRTPAERDKNPDRICLDRRGLTAFPTIIGESKLRLLSLQHNRLTRIDGCNFSQLTKLVFLDLYDNQIENVGNLVHLENLRVLLMGKNRIKRIEGLKQLSKLEVLDFHGNQIIQVSGLEELVSLKVLNLAGNNIKTIGHHDFQGLLALKELNLRRNRIKKLLGFGETPSLQKLYLSNNDIQKIEDMGSLAKASQLKEITIDGNPLTVNNDYISFLVSYLPNLQLLSTMPISEQTKRTAMAWRTNKEQCSSAFQDLSTQICMNVRREEVISNAKTNWEFHRCHTKLSTEKGTVASNARSHTVNSPHAQKSNKFNMVKPKTLEKTKVKGFGSLTSINENIEAKKIHIKKRSSSSENLFRVKDTTTAYPLEFKLPPILGSIVDSLINNKVNEKMYGDGRAKLGKQKDCSDAETAYSDPESVESHESSKTTLRPNLMQSSSHAGISESCKRIFGRKLDLLKIALPVSITSKCDEDNVRRENDIVFANTNVHRNEAEDVIKTLENTILPYSQDIQNDYPSKSTTNSSGYCSLSSKASSLDSCKSVLSDSSGSSVTKNVVQKLKDSEKERSRIKSAQIKKLVYYKSNRAATARAKYKFFTPPNSPPVPNPPKEREQGGDYLIEILGRCLNVYGQGALRFVDRPWDVSKAQDVNIVKFNYVQFNDIAKILSKLKIRFPNVEHFTFKETNISYLGQLNALAEVQGLTSIHIEAGNPIISKDWRTYAIFRLAHWGLKIVNDKEIMEEEIELANQEYAGLADIVMRSLPESLLQPVLQRLRLDKVQKQSGEEVTAKEFLLKSDPSLRSVVAKEALQWRKGSITQEDLIWRHRGKMQLLSLIDLTVNAIEKLQLLEKEWPDVLCEIIRTTLCDYSQMDEYMKRCTKTLENRK